MVSFEVYMIKPKNSISQNGSRTDFVKFLLQTINFERTYVYVTWYTTYDIRLLINNSSIVFPMKRISSKYITKDMLFLRNNVIGTFIKSVKTLGSGSRPKQRHKNNYRLPVHKNFTNFLDDLWSETKKYPSFSDFPEKIVFPQEEF